MAASTSGRSVNFFRRLHCALSDPLPREQLRSLNASPYAGAGGVGDVLGLGSVVTGVDCEGPPPPQDSVKTATTATARNTTGVTSLRHAPIIKPLSRMTPTADD
jgi:hypothetical protein